MKTVGFFEEMDLYDNDGPIKTWLSYERTYDHKKVLAYLKKGDVMAVCAKPVFDPIAKHEISHSFRVLTDKEYMWPTSLIYFVENYNINLPKDFLAKIEKAEEVKENEV